MAWCEKGKNITIDKVAGGNLERCVAAAGAISTHLGQILVEFTEKAYDGDKFSKFMDRLLTMVTRAFVFAGPPLVVLDNASIHDSPECNLVYRSFANVEVIHTVPYSPW